MAEKKHTQQGLFQRLFSGRGEPMRYPADLPSAGPARDRTGQIPVVVPEVEFQTGQLPRIDHSAPETSEIVAATTLAELTTMRVGGRFERLLVARSAEQLADYAARLWDADEPWLLLGGGSNTVVSDAGYPGTVVLVRNSGIEQVADAQQAAASGQKRVRLRVQAGQDWDDLVAWTVERGYAGIEMLSGIPGMAGAAPVQNIGAYGGELAQVLHSVTVYDRYLGRVRQLDAAQLELGYRDSILKQGYQAVVLSIDLLLTDNSDQEVPLGEPIVFAQLAQALDVRLGARVPLAKVRESVLQLRAKKGMVLNDTDHNTWSCGSFFTNPIVSEKFARTLPAEAPRFAVAPVQKLPLVTTFQELAAGHELRMQNYRDYPAAAQPASVLSADTLGADRQAHLGGQLPATDEPAVKLSAAWLIENAGVPRGFRLPGSGAAVSDLHTLAITNRGGASAADVAELARYIVSMVQTEFGVILVPEPNIYGLEV